MRYFSEIHQLRTKKSAGIAGALVKPPSCGMAARVLVVALKNVSSTPRVASSKARRQVLHYSRRTSAVHQGNPEPFLLSSAVATPARSGGSGGDHRGCLTRTAPNSMKAYDRTLKPPKTCHSSVDDRNRQGSSQALGASSEPRLLIVLRERQHFWAKIRSHHSKDNS